MLELENISITLGEFSLHDVSLEIETGEYMAIIGKTGAGKTILLETLAGIYSQESGSITLNGREITGVPPKDRSITMVYQDYMLFPHLTVEENIGFGLKNRHVDPEIISEKVHEVAEIFAISHLLHRHPGTLSGGEKQRTAISRAIVMEPDVLLLDEPLSALDTQTRAKLKTELKKLHSRFKTTIIHITHNFDEVFSLADRVAIMEDGRILQVGSPDEVFRRPSSGRVAKFVGMKNIFECECRPEGGKTFINLDGHEMVSSGILPSSHKGLKAMVAVRPEDIEIYPGMPAVRSENVFPGTVENITGSGAFFSVIVNCSRPFEAFLSRQQFSSINISESDSVYLSFSPDSLHVFSGEES